MRSAAERTTAALWTKFGPARSGRLSSGRNAGGKGRDLPSAIPRLSARGRDPAVRDRKESSISSTICPIPGSSASTVDGELYSSIRISVLTSRMADVASVEVFGDILHPRLDGARSSSIRPALSPIRTRQGFPELPYVTLRLAMSPASYFNADIGLATVRAEHQAFYRRVFLHETIAEPRLYPGLVKPVGLMAARLSGDARTRSSRAIRIMRSSAFERRMLFERGDGIIPPRDVGLPVRARLDRPAVLTGRSRRSELDSAVRAWQASRDRLPVLRLATVQGDPRIGR